MPLSTGEKIKQSLGLEKIKNVKINRAAISSKKILFVWYDTYRPNMPITSRRIKTWPYVAHIFHGTDLYYNTDKATPFTPPMDIEDYNGALRGSLIIPVDLAGDRFIDTKRLTKKFESVKLNNKFYSYVKPKYPTLSNEPVPIFFNPNKAEVIELYNNSQSFGLRGLYYDGNIFLTSAELLHTELINEINKTAQRKLDLDKHAVTFEISFNLDIIRINYNNKKVLNDFYNSDFYKKYFIRFEPSETKIIFELATIQPVYITNIQEFVTLDDLNDTGIISDFTQTWRKDRNRVMGAENIVAKLIDCIVDEADRSVTFQFLTEATELRGKQPNDNIDSDYRFYDGPKGEVDPETLNITRNRSRTYEMQIKILDFFDWLNVFEGEKIGRKEINEILEVSNIQVFSTAPSFQMQGFNYWLTQVDGSIYPEGRKPQRWDAFHGDGEAFLDKHLYGLLRQIKFFGQQMGSMLTGKLKNRRLI